MCHKVESLDSVSGPHPYCTPCGRPSLPGPVGRASDGHPQTVITKVRMTLNCISKNAIYSTVVQCHCRPFPFLLQFPFSPPSASTIPNRDVATFRPDSGLGIPELWDSRTNPVPVANLPCHLSSQITMAPKKRGLSNVLLLPR
jgi:hypothetical protein